MRLSRAGLVASVALVLAACGSTPATVESASSGSAASAVRTGFVGWDDIRTEAVEENSFVSDGDEPFVAVLRIRSTTGVPNSTRWAWVTDSPKASGPLKEGNQTSIDDGSGDAWFTGDLAVKPLEETQFIGMNTKLTADMMVTVAFVLEEDGGNTATDVQVLKSLTDPVVKQVATIVEGANIPITPMTVLDPSLATKPLLKLVETAKKIDAPSITNLIIIQLLQRFVDAGGDPNDVIGVATTAFIPSTGQLLTALQKVGITPSTLQLLGPGQGDGNQEWTNYQTWRYPLTIPVLGDGYIAGEVWYGFLTDRWVEDWMYVESAFPWQGRVKYWLKATASMRA